MTSYTLAIVLANSVAIDIGDRLVVKLKDTNTASKTVEIEFAGTNYSRLDTPLSSVPNLVDISCVSVSASGDVTATAFHGSGAALTFAGLPTSDPLVAGALWISGTAVQVSSGP
jgi:hypothetical protein